MKSIIVSTKGTVPSTFGGSGQSLIAFLSLILISNAPVYAEVQSDIEYGKAGDESLLLDACVPDGPGPFPVAIIVHGGGWGSGDKAKDMSLLFKPLTDAKFVWFSINYRLAPKHLFPACIEDVEQGIRWIKKHATEYKGDPKRIALIGESAGGHLVALAATRVKDDTRVNAVVAFAGPFSLPGEAEYKKGMSGALKRLFNREKYDDESKALLVAASPLFQVKADLPPFLLIHGTADKSVLYQQSVDFQKKLKDLNVPCELITIENGAHGMTNWEKLNVGYKEKMIVWLKETLKEK